MSRKLIRDAFEKRLATLTPEWPTSLENVPFKIMKNTSWQKMDLMFAETQPGGRGDNAGEIWAGYCQLTIFTPAKYGPSAAEERAALIRGDRGQGITGHFFRGQTLSESGLRITVYQPVDGNVIDEADWWGFPVRIPFDCHVD